MSVLSACQDAATEMGLNAPSAVYASTEKFASELGALANEAAQYISKQYDWRKFVTLNTFNGTGSVTDFDMPSDFDRIIQGGRIFRSITLTPMELVLDLNDWLYRRMQTITNPVGECIILGGQMQIYPVMGASETTKFYYCSTKIVIDENDTAKAAFSMDSDEFRLPERLLKLALKWKWRAMKKLDSADEQEEFEIALAQEIARDKGPRVIAVGTPRFPGDIETAYPGVISA